MLTLSRIKNHERPVQRMSTVILAGARAGRNRRSDLRELSIFRLDDYEGSRAVLEEDHSDVTHRLQRWGQLLLLTFLFCGKLFIWCNSICRWKESLIDGWRRITDRHSLLQNPPIWSAHWSSSYSSSLSNRQNPVRPSYSSYWLAMRKRIGWMYWLLDVTHCRHVGEQ